MLLKTPMNLFNNKVFKKLRDKNFKVARILSLVLTNVVSFGLIAFFFYVLFPQLIKSMGKLVEKLPIFISSLFTAFEKMFSQVDVNTKFLEGLSKTILTALQSLFNSFIDMTPDLVKFGKSAIVFFSNLFFAFAFSGYVLVDKEGMKRRFDKSVDAIFSERPAIRIKDIEENCVMQFDNFFYGQISKH